MMISVRIALSVMLLFTSIGHFKFSKGMSMMLPEKFPAKYGFIWATGFLEIFAAIGLLFPRTSRTTGIMLCVFFISILPANIYACYKRVNYERADYTGNGPEYLWFRIPFQILLIALTYFFVIIPYR